MKEESNHPIALGYTIELTMPPCGQVNIPLFVFVVLSLVSSHAFIDDDGFISIVPKESLKPPYDKTRCGYIPYGPKTGRSA